MVKINPRIRQTASGRSMRIRPACAPAGCRKRPEEESRAQTTSRSAGPSRNRLIPRERIREMRSLSRMISSTCSGSGQKGSGPSEKKSGSPAEAPASRAKASVLPAEVSSLLAEASASPDVSALSAPAPSRSSSASSSSIFPNSEMTMPTASFSDFPSLFSASYLSSMVRSISSLRRTSSGVSGSCANRFSR